MIKLITILMMILTMCGNGEDISETALYSTTAAVIDIDYENDLITVVTFADITYRFSDNPDDWNVGDLAAMTMLNNNTPKTLLDDEIVGEPRYVGWVSEWGFDNKTNSPKYFFDWD